jgi:two-component system response regulator HydG
LVVDDDRDMCKMVKAHLERRGFEVCWYSSAQEALESLDKELFDVVLADLMMPTVDGLTLCKQVVEVQPDLPVIVITAFGSLETAVAALRAGAFDFVTKPIEMDLLFLAVDRAVKNAELRRQVSILSEAVKNRERYGDLLGKSTAIKRLFDQIERVSDSDASVLIVGESGTGKELVATELHKRGRRKHGSFVAINCSALPRELLESELFGHARGAFTDAKSPRKGLLLKSDGGTLFLDEIGELPLTLQPKLLRALEKRCFRPLGSDTEIRFDTRLITASNRDLEAALAEGSFRTDLYYRINVIQLEVPPLRKRGNDVLLLARHFVEYFAARAGKPMAGISEAAAAKLLEYEWPGNVRELRNAIERAIALARFSQVALEDLPQKIRGYRRPTVPLEGLQAGHYYPLAEIERRHILQVLEAVDGNKSMAARVLGLDRKTLYRKLLQYGDAVEEEGS